MSGTHFPPLPSSRVDNLYSYYPFHISTRERTHASLRGTSTSINVVSSTSLGSLDDRRRVSKHAIERATRRALRGQRPAGSGIGMDAQDLSDEEQVLDEEKSSINNFGHRFLLPFGRRLTQMEMEAAPSPTPSDHEHRQEERNGVSSAMHTPEPEEEEEEVDLDASIEDRDDEGQSTEYDSDDLRLMRAMDRSVGSHTPESSEGGGDSGEDMEEE